jgi:hypothetical protein
MQVADVGKPWDFRNVEGDERIHMNDEQLVGLSFKRPSDGLIVQATEFCERFDGAASLGRFAFDAREEWTIRLKQWDPNPAFYPMTMDSYLGDYMPDGSILKLYQSRKDPWPTNLRCAFCMGLLLDPQFLFRPM